MNFGRTQVFRPNHYFKKDLPVLIEKGLQRGQGWIQENQLGEYQQFFWECIHDGMDGLLAVDLSGVHVDVYFGGKCPPD